MCPLGGIVRVISPPVMGTGDAQLLGREMKIKRQPLVYTFLTSFFCVCVSVIQMCVQSSYKYK